MTEPVALRALTGTALENVLENVAQLRIEVFRAWPYLYDGDLAYERDYLSAYSCSEQAIVVGAFDGAQLVGASTGAPLADHSDDFADAFAGTGLDIEQVFYCAESVLLPAYRGRGLGHGFFDLREAHARALGFRHCAFCSVCRPDDHPARPSEPRTLDLFWRKRGYQPLEGAIASFSWKDVGDDSESAKQLQFWHRSL